MPIDLAIKNTPDDVVELLEERARKNRRSLEREVLAILEDAVRTQARRKLTIREVLDAARRSGLRTGAESTAIIRADRDSNHGH
jgi:plasmid stability protein